MQMRKSGWTKSRKIAGLLAAAVAGVLPLAARADVQQWSAPYGTLPVPVPSPARYAAHSRATLCGGHLCLILTATGEMKIFADGVQVFRFLDGRWRINPSGVCPE